MAIANVFSTRTVDTFATRDFNFRMRKYAQCGPRLTPKIQIFIIWIFVFLTFLIFYSKKC